MATELMKTILFKVNCKEIIYQTSGINHI